MRSSSQTQSFDRFVHGSTFFHVLSMTLTSSIGLMAIFAVDFMSLFFLSRLKNPDITAAIGYCGPLSFAVLSLSLGFAIAAAVLVSRHVGAQDRPESDLSFHVQKSHALREAKQIATSALVLSMVASGIAGGAVFFWRHPLLIAFGASGPVLSQSELYLAPLMLSTSALGGSITATLCLRAIGDLNGSMLVTLVMAVVNGVLDPLLIFGLKLNIQGAGLATSAADVLSCAVGVFLLSRHHFLIPISFERFKRDLSPLLAISFPVILTQLASPFAQFYLAHFASRFGTDVVAATAILNRLSPVAFGVIFALSGAVGPIVGQNFGAQRFDRVAQTFKDALSFSVFYVSLTCLFLFFFRHGIAEAFSAQGRTRDLVVFYCGELALLFVFSACQFVSQAVFNALHKPHWSTVLNWVSALGMIPALSLGAHFGGAFGMLVGSFIPPIPSGLLSLFFAYKLISHQKNLLEDGKRLL